MIFRIYISLKYTSAIFNQFKNINCQVIKIRILEGKKLKYLKPIVCAAIVFYILFAKTFIVLLQSNNFELRI